MSRVFLKAGQLKALEDLRSAGEEGSKEAPDASSSYENVINTMDILERSKRNHRKFATDGL